ncbi:MAG: hypothetical protein J6P74_07935 [Paludibacteraceae bacterium]|nr:hypothetical protein [Paludibacteraceae bacterium]
MKKINIFIASSSELKHERDELTDLFLDLNQETFYDNGIRLHAERWEYADSSMRIARKEDEYLNRLRTCEISITMFWHTLGEYTLEELDVAEVEKKAGRLPKANYVFFKKPINSLSSELTNFKDSFAERYPSVPTYTFDDYITLRQQVAEIIYKNLPMTSNQ